jgi:hypothetical protein
MSSETVNLKPTETYAVMGGNKMNAQIFILNVCSKLLPNPNCQWVSNMGVFVPHYVAIIRVLKKEGVNILLRI